MSMAIHPALVCVLCGRPTVRVRAHDKRAAHDIDCVTCGKYRISVAEEARIAAVGPPIVATLGPAIKRVNARGFRLSIPEQTLIPLARK